MSSFTNITHEALASIPDEPSARPTIAIQELIDSPELGTEANPIVIRGESAPPGSASNPTVFYFDEDCGYYGAEQLDSDADTKIMATPEFRENLIDESARADKGAFVSSASIPAPTRLPGCEDQEESQMLDQSPRIQMAENTLHIEDCPSYEDAKSENGAKGESESEQNRERGDTWEAEKPATVHSLLETSFTTSNAISQGQINETEVFA